VSSKLSTIQRFLAAAAVGAAAAGGATTAAHASTIAVHYVALGDSYAAGTGTFEYDPAFPVCDRSSAGYPGLWAAEHNPTSFDAEACSGATTDTVRSEQLSHLDADTTLVTIQVGGNDVNFQQTAADCLFKDGGFASDDDCKAAVRTAKNIATTTLPAKLDATYTAIRSNAPNAKVVVVGYPHLYAAQDDSGVAADCSLGAAKRWYFNEGADDLSDVVANRAAAAGFTYIDPRPAFDGHGACTSSGAWVNDIDFSHLDESLHPNVEGYKLGYLPLLNSATS
jgi:lysophospholipase L1-like esterase